MPTKISHKNPRCELWIEPQGGRTTTRKKYIALRAHSRRHEDMKKKNHDTNTDKTKNEEDLKKNGYRGFPSPRQSGPTDRAAAALFCSPVSLVVTVSHPWLKGKNDWQPTNHETMMNQRTNEWFNDQGINEAMNQPTNWPTNQLNETMNQWINQSMNQWTNDWTNQPND